MNMKSKSSIVLNKSLPILNSRLISNQRLTTEDVDKLNKLHLIRNCYTSLMQSEEDSTNLRYLASIVTQIDFQLQKIWKFKLDENYHKFWNLPGCECPKLDNMDMYGTGHRYTNPNCPIHGKI